MSVEHWMMFSTFAEQRHFEYPEPGTYQGIVINANMAVHAPAGLASFLLEKTTGPKYLVDPLTHAFQHDPSLISNSEGEPKSSIKNLAEEYGEPLASIAGKRPVLPGDFTDEERLKSFVGRCVDFQKTHLTNYMKNSDAAKYLDETDIKPPYAVIAPYFYLTETTLDDWLDVCVRAMECADIHIGVRNGLKLFAAAIVSQGIILDSQLRIKVANAFNGSHHDVDGFIFWVDNLEEQTASTEHLAGMIDFARLLRNGQKREVINLHGGYFSVLAGGNAGKGVFSGVTHAPEFGEFRSVVPVGGGIPIARYYIPQLHARVRYRDAARLFRLSGWLAGSRDFHQNVCDCEECTTTIDNDPENFGKFGESNVHKVRRKTGIVRIDYPTREAKIHCLRHYLQRKKYEYAKVSKQTKDELLGMLQADEQMYKEKIGLDGVAHLKRWRMIFQAEA